jgi:hypothetical protein
MCECKHILNNSQQPPLEYVVTCSLRYSAIANINYDYESSLFYEYINNLQTTLAADAHVAGHFLLEDSTLNIEKSLRS